MAFRTNKTPVLQEKSASGAVASFNTALAMPLSSCNIAVNAWQEGSGDPSPSNVRPIHGFSEVNATRVGKNLCPYKDVEGVRRERINISLLPNTYTLSAVCTSEDTVYNQCAFLFEFIDGSYSSLKQLNRNVRSSENITLSKKTRYLYLYASVNDPYSANLDFKFSDIQIEVGSTATAYEPYVTPTIYTIQLGQEVYGAEVDVVNGVAHCNHIIVDFSTITFTVPLSSFPHYFRARIRDANSVRADVICDVLKTVPQAIDAQNTNLTITKSDGINFYIHDDECNSNEDIHAKYDGHKICYGIATPFDIQLTPTQIKTLIGNNTIFTDTGDIDLTYKDLDIAKRGNFREVFKLPS